MKRLFFSLVVLGAIGVFGITSAPAAHANQAPVAAARISVDGGATWAQDITLTQGFAYTALVDGTGSSDPDGWTTLSTGVSSNGYCAMNTDFATDSFSSTSKIFKPATPGDCKRTHTVTATGPSALSPGTYKYPVLYIQDTAGAVSGWGYVTIHVNPFNYPPTEAAQISVNGSAPGLSITVAQGVPAHVTLDGSRSQDSNGWTTAGYGVSQGGQCAWNADLEKGSSPTYERIISNPATPSSCNIDLGMITFNDPAGTYLYRLLQVKDVAGALSTPTYVSISVVASANSAPIAAARASIDGGTTWSTSITAVKGTTYNVMVDGTGSSDPDGWTTAGKGLSNGTGYCAMNNDLIEGSFIGTHNILTPATPGDCKFTHTSHVFNESIGAHKFAILYLHDAAGADSAAWGYVTVNVVAADGNHSPVAVAQIKIDNSVYGLEQAVTQGVPSHVYLSAVGSYDPDTWQGGSGGGARGITPAGKCEWNTDLNLGVTTYERAIQHPTTSSYCDVDLGIMTFNNAPGRYVYPVLRLTDGEGLESNVASITIVVLTRDANLAPVAIAKFSASGAQPQSHIYVSRGVPVQISLDAASSYEPNGWTTPGTGVSQGGKCEWNTNLDQSKPAPFTKVIINPSSPSACNVNLGTLVFNDPPGTYTYALLRITDANGVQSLVARDGNRSHSLFARLFPSAHAQSADGSAMVTIVDGPTPTPSTSPNVSPSPSCNPFGYNPNCPPPTPTSTPTDTPSPTPTVVPTTSVEPTSTPTSTPSPTPTPSPCTPEAVCTLAGGVVDSAVTSISNGVDAIQHVVTNAIAKLLNTDPVQVAKFIAEKSKTITGTLAAIALALSAPFLASNIVPAAAQWGQFLGSFFTIQKRKGRWGIVVDSDLGKPVAQAVVQVFDAQFNQLKETQVTGADGQFGFLLPVGRYYIIASEAGFVFPARKKPPVTLRDGERIYLGEEFEIMNQDPEKIPHIVVPMDREETAPTGNTILRRYWDQLIEFVDRVGFIFLFVGGGINTYLLLLLPGKLNIAFEVLYLLLFMLKLYILLSHQRGIGSVVDRVSRKMLDLSIIRLYDAKTNRIIQTKVTNKNGRFFILAPRGEYTASVSKPGYKTLLINKLHIKSSSSKALALNFALETVK